MENEAWEQTEEILQNLFKEKLQLKNISLEKMRKVGNKEKNNKQTIVGQTKNNFKSSETKRHKHSIKEDYSKETLELGKEKQEEVKELRNNGTDAILVCDNVVTKGRYRKQ